MKKSFFFIFAILIYNLGFGQTNPVKNLVWTHYYDSTNYYNVLSLSWQEPEIPHSNLIGYNIYRSNELYRFQTNTSLGCNPDWGVTDGCGFENYNNGPFTGYVAAVYEGGIESEYVSFEVLGSMLGINEISLKPINIFPNPVKNILNFSEEVSNIRISDLSGKILKQISDTEKSINVSTLAKGTYIITATTKTGEVINKKFIKE